MYSSSVSAPWGKTFPAASIERAVHREEDIKEKEATVADYVPKVHSDVHHLVQGTNEVDS